MMKILPILKQMLLYTNKSPNKKTFIKILIYLFLYTNSYIENMIQICEAFLHFT